MHSPTNCYNQFTRCSHKLQYFTVREAPATLASWEIAPALSQHRVTLFPNRSTMVYLCNDVETGQTSEDPISCGSQCFDSCSSAVSLLMRRSSPLKCASGSHKASVIPVPQWFKKHFYDPLTFDLPLVWPQNATRNKSFGCFCSPTSDTLR